jgi:hypothetical protein
MQMSDDLFDMFDRNHDRKHRSGHDHEYDHEHENRGFGFGNDHHDSDHEHDHKEYNHHNDEHGNYRNRQAYRETEHSVSRGFGQERHHDSGDFDPALLKSYADKILHNKFILVSLIIGFVLILAVLLIAVTMFLPLITQIVNFLFNNVLKEFTK